jgi:nitric oxide reductase subunit B
VPGGEQPTGKRQLLVSKAWIQVAALVVLVGFFVLVLLAYETYKSDPPIPDKVVDPSGRVLFTGNDIRAGQKVFLHHGLMEYGSIFGHGAYLGPDFTDDYLHRSSAIVQGELGGSGSDSARQETIDQFQTNRYDSDTKTLPFSVQQASAFGQLQQHYSDFLDSDTTRYGLLPNPVMGPTEIHQLTAFQGGDLDPGLRNQQLTSAGRLVAGRHASGCFSSSSPRSHQIRTMDRCLRRAS